MTKYKFVYCKKCDDFYLSYNVNFGNNKPVCPLCYFSPVDILHANSFAEMEQIERMYKIKKIITKQNKI